MTNIHPPVWPFRGLRGVDAFGAGGFGAPRDQGTRRHDGTDFISAPGDFAAAPIAGKAVARGLAYPHHAMLPDLHSFHIEGTGPFKGWHVMLLYVATAPEIIGRTLEQGEEIGVCEDLPAYYALKYPNHPGLITCHVHLELDITEARKVDAARLLPGGIHT